MLSDQNEIEKRMKRLSAIVIHLAALIIIISIASGILALESKPANVSEKETVLFKSQKRIKNQGRNKYNRPFFRHACFS
jgi:hypothetical protein